MNTINQAETSAPNDEISLKELVAKVKEWGRYLIGKWLFIVVCGVLGAALGILYAYTQKPVYTATTTFVLEDQKGGGGLGSLAGLAAVAGVDMGGGGGGLFQGDNILELYKSRKMITQTLLSPLKDEQGKTQLLIDRYIAFNQIRKTWEKKPALKNLDFNQPNQALSAQQARLKDSVMANIVNTINKGVLSVTRVDKKLSIIKAEVKSEDELFAKEFNSQIVKQVNDFYVQTKTKKSVENVAILQHKTDSVRAVMNGAIYSAAAVADATPNLNPTRQVQRIAPIQRSQFSAETNKSILATLVQNLEMAKVGLAKDAPLIQVIDEPIYPLQKDKLGKLKGLLIGGVLAGFLSVLFLIGKRILKELA